MLVSRYIVIFSVFSFFGWIWETIYCTIYNGKWEDRGFLYGPVCPIYGVGASAGVALVEFLQSYGFQPLRWWQVLLIGFFGSIVLEYTTHWGLEKIFHAYWWDYSKMPLNINGRVCFPASCGFAVAGLLVVYVFAPACAFLTRVTPVILFEISALVLIALFAVDMTLTVSALTGFDKKINEIDESINLHITDTVDALFRQTAEFQTKALKRVKGFKFPKARQDRLHELIEKIKNSK